MSPVARALAGPLPRAAPSVAAGISTKRIWRAFLTDARPKPIANVEEF
jgi:hypothetical protein